MDCDINNGLFDEIVSKIVFATEPKPKIAFFHRKFNKQSVSSSLLLIYKDESLT